MRKRNIIPLPESNGYGLKLKKIKKTTQAQTIIIVLDYIIPVAEIADAGDDKICVYIIVVCDC